MNKKDIELLYRVDERLSALERDIPNRNQWREGMSKKMDAVIESLTNYQLLNVKSTADLCGDVRWLTWCVRGLYTLIGSILVGVIGLN